MIRKISPFPLCQRGERVAQEKNRGAGRSPGRLNILFPFLRNDSDIVASLKMIY